MQDNPDRPIKASPSSAAADQQNASAEIHITSIFTAKPGLEVHSRQELLEYVKATLKNPNCQSIRFMQESGRKDSFMLYSVWKSEAAFIEHLGSPIVREYALKNQKYGDPKLFVRRWQLLEDFENT